MLGLSGVTACWIFVVFGGFEATLYKQGQKMFQLWLGSGILVFISSLWCLGETLLCYPIAWCFTEARHLVRWHCTVSHVRSRLVSQWVCGKTIFKKPSGSEMALMLHSGDFLREH